MNWQAAGQKVIVVDRGTIAGGMTSRTTAHLAPICDDGVSSLTNLRGEETARLFQQSQEAAVDRIEAIVEEHDIACNFRRLDAFLFPGARHGARARRASSSDEEYEARARQAPTSSASRACRSRASRTRRRCAIRARRPSIR